jgi:hypothetical protein
MTDPFLLVCPGCGGSIVPSASNRCPVAGCRRDLQDVIAYARMERKRGLLCAGEAFVPTLSSVNVRQQLIDAEGEE